MFVNESVMHNYEEDGIHEFQGRFNSQKSFDGFRESAHSLQKIS